MVCGNYPVYRKVTVSFINLLDTFRPFGYYSLKHKGHQVNLCLLFSGRTVSTETQNLNLTPDDLDPCILKHMSQNMGFRLSEIIRLVTSNMPHSATATYHLFQVRLDCYVAKSRVQGKIHASQSRVANSLVSLFGILG